MGMGRQATMNVTKLSALLASTSLTASRALLHARPAVPPASSPRPPVGSHPHPHRRFGGRRASRRRRASSHRRAGAGAGDGDGGPPHPSAASPAPGGRLTVERIAEALGDGSYRDVLVVAGAGVSCSAGIPDVREPGASSPAVRRIARIAFRFVVRERPARRLRSRAFAQLGSMSMPAIPIAHTKLPSRLRCKQFRTPGSGL